MASRAILVCFHKYTTFGGQFYEPILDFFLASMKKYENEYDQLYLIDSNWEINPEKIKDMKAQIVRVNPSLRYYDVYKAILPQVKEDLVLFMDNDMVVYRKNTIYNTFAQLDNSYQFIKTGEYGVVSIIDEIGEYKTDKLKNGNKFCPYWFAARKELLMKYRDVDWGVAPFSETLGYLTEAMLNDDVKVYEWPEDKSSIYFEGMQDGEKGKDLGYMHIRAGSSSAVLLAWKNSPEHKHSYEDYLKTQPKNETLRHCAWYRYMGGDAGEITIDLGINYQEFWVEYYNKFKEYHGLEDR